MTRDLLPHIDENGISGEIADIGSCDMAKGSKVKPSKPTRTGPKPLSGGSGQPLPPK